MADPRQIEADLKEYLEKADNLRNADKYLYLKAIFDKHFATEKMDHVIKKYDLFGIVSSAKSLFTAQTVRPHVSGREIEQGEKPMLAMIEAFIRYLNSHHLLKRGIAVDYTDPSSDLESLEDTNG